MTDKPSQKSSATGTWWKGVYHTIRSRLLNKTKHKTIIYRYDPEAEMRAADEETSDLEIRCYQNMAEMPDDIFETLPDKERRELPEHFRTLFAEGGTLYLVMAGNEIACHGWTIRRSSLNDWHAEISDDAVIVYAAGTRQKFRGRGLQRVRLRHIIAVEKERGATLYCDAAEWNAVTRRNIEACGFRQIGVNERPLKS